jgi:sugar O-acyltransferase (sialic acid O-acetyltransferase NeuD family)
MTARPLFLLGAGGLARETLAAARARPDVWDVRGALDDDPRRHGSTIDGVPVLGGCALVHDHADAAVVACVASPRRPEARADLVRRLDLPADRWATVIHPAASLPPGLTPGPGSIVLAQAVITAPVELGEHLVMMPHVLITHDDVVGAFVTLAGRVSLGGGVVVGPCAYLGQGSSVRENVRIGDSAVVGMGAVVLADVPANETWVGIPARKLAAR